jgi:hypothetical protein
VIKYSSQVVDLIGNSSLDKGVPDGESLSGILCARHSMTRRSMYAEQDEDEECGDSRSDGGAAVDPEGTH